MYGRKEHLANTVGFRNALQESIREYYLLRVQEPSFGRMDHMNGGHTFSLFKLGEREVAYIVKRALEQHLPRHMYLEEKFSEEAQEILMTKFELKQDHYQYTLVIPKEEFDNEKRT